MKKNNYLFSKNEPTKYNLSTNTINPESKSYNHINNLTHPNFYFIQKRDEKNDILTLITSSTTPYIEKLIKLIPILLYHG